jgi:hypothetical protein
LESNELKSWFRQAKAVSDIEQNVLWLHGNPGIGKSTMAMMLAEELPPPQRRIIFPTVIAFFLLFSAIPTLKITERQSHYCEVFCTKSSKRIHLLWNK